MYMQKYGIDVVISVRFIGQISGKEEMENY